MNKAGLFGGGWEDYLDALNEAFDRHVAENMPPHPFGASVDAIMTGYPDDASGSLLFDSLEHAPTFPMRHMLLVEWAAIFPVCREPWLSRLR